MSNKGRGWRNAIIKCVIYISYVQFLLVLQSLFLIAYVKVKRSHTHNFFIRSQKSHGIASPTANLASNLPLTNPFKGVKDFEEEKKNFVAKNKNNCACRKFVHYTFSISKLEDTWTHIACKLSAVKLFHRISLAWRFSVSSNSETSNSTLGSSVSGDLEKNSNNNKFMSIS